ncbi:MAG: alginate lyase family protein [Candidatus Symbiothrix sp.]|nr:alginate lyase family protein [Candidatus Symbiothrix sp.]
MKHYHLQAVAVLLIFGFQLSIQNLTAQNFIHPGGLHTQADFDRIKAQLAAGDPTTTAAWNRLCANSYSQSTYTPSPTVEIIRGSGYPENYANAFRDVAAAYQNALRWKIAGTVANAEKAIQILNAWARICVAISGSPDTALALGIYGYEFAQVGELMRDYEGWSEADFKKYQKWMLTVWYPGNINFNRTRWGQWQNNNNPGHHWSNWGLCNMLSLLSIGILCDDVFIYNQGVSYYKYDQVGTFQNNNNAPKKNDGFNEFIGNLVPAFIADARGPYGYIGQMQESGRDQGHASMAAGLGTDAAQIMWNQGDDAFAFMNNRLAAGITWTALVFSEGQANLPWIEYWYKSQAQNWDAAWKMTGPASGDPNFRPYWDRVLGHYEGIKGVSIPAAHVARDVEAIDGGGGHYGTNSGGFDHLGFSTLTCYRPTVAPADSVPYTLVPYIIYNGQTLQHSELGGLTNTYATNMNNAIPAGRYITLSPQLPAGATDDGQWSWDTGETTREISFIANQSAMCRVTYTSANGRKSTQLFSIAVYGSCTPDRLTSKMETPNSAVNDSVMTVLSGSTVRMTAYSSAGWGEWAWEGIGDATTSVYTVRNVTRDTTYTVVYTNQGGAQSRMTFHIKVSSIQASLSIDNAAAQLTNQAFLTAGQTVELKPKVATNSTGGSWLWSDGSTAQNRLLENVQHSQFLSVTYTLNGTPYTLDYKVYVTVMNKGIANGNYFIKNASNGLYLTNDGVAPVFDEKSIDAPATQGWKITQDGTRYKIYSMTDNRFINEYGVFSVNPYYQTWNTYSFHGVEGGDFYSLQNGGSAGTDYWTINDNGTLNGKGASAFSGFPFEIVPYSTTAIETPQITPPQPDDNSPVYSILGQKIGTYGDLPFLKNGIYITNGKKFVISR